MGRDDDGELLIEVVAALAIVAVAVLGLVAALGTTFHLSSRSRVTARGDLLLARYAEALAVATYEPCHSGVVPYQDAATTAIPSAGLPTGVSTGAWGSGDGTSRTFELAVESTAYWTGATNPVAFTGTCGAFDRGAQALHLRARSGDGAFDRRLTIVKRAS